MSSPAANQDTLTKFYEGLAVSAGIAKSAEGEAWLKAIDAKTSAAQLRQFLQANGEYRTQFLLRLLIDRFRNCSDSRHKLDFIVSEYLASFAPASLQEQHTVSFSDVADLLTPMLGPVGNLPDWMPELEDLITELAAYEHLHELAEHGLFDRGRSLKSKVAQKGIDNVALVAFARFNFLLRRTFTQLWEADLWWIDQALIELESRAEFFIDCSGLGLSPIEPTNELAAMVRKWQRPLFNEYADDTTYQRVQQLRKILEAALQPGAA